MMQMKKTHEEFIEDLKVKNPKAYESLTFLSKYNGASNKIKVCDKYGDMMMYPSNLLNGAMPCIVSAINKHEYFIGMLKIKNLSLLNDFKFIGRYEQRSKKIKLMSKYGEVAVIPGDLLSGSAPGINSAINKNSYFANMAEEKHGKKYDYSLVEYKYAHSKIKIICKKHGSFWQVPNSHLNGSGCPKCGKETASLKNSCTQEEIISRITEKYGDKYDLSKVYYKHSSIKILIGCKKYNHGFFSIKVGDLLGGCGCPKCYGRFDKQYKKNNIAAFEVFNNSFEFVGIKCRRSTKDENILEVQCHLCKKWFNPTYSAATNKKSFINGTVNGYGEQNLYCSEECKTACPTFGFRTDSIDPRSKLYIEKTESQKARNCQTNVIKQLQCQNDGKLYCERCGNEIHNIDAELHHTYKISKYGMKASDHESQMLVCAKCHLELHNNCK